MNDNYPDSKFIEYISEIFKTSGVLLIDRMILPNKIIKNSHYSSKEGLIFDLDIEKLDEKLVNSLKNEEIKVSISQIFEKTICSKCKLDYINCSHSKYLDDVTQEVESMKPAFVILTDI